MVGWLVGWSGGWAVNNGNGGELVVGFGWLVEPYMYPPGVRVRVRVHVVVPFLVPCRAAPGFMTPGLRPTAWWIAHPPRHWLPYPFSPYHTQPPNPPPLVTNSPPISIADRTPTNQPTNQPTHLPFPLLTVQPPDQPVVNGHQLRNSTKKKM